MVIFMDAMTNGGTTSQNGDLGIKVGSSSVSSRTLLRCRTLSDLDATREGLGRDGARSLQR